MADVKFNENQLRFLRYMHVGRLATTNGRTMNVVPMCPVHDGAVFYMATHGTTRKVRDVRRHEHATLLIDQYSDDWLRHVGVMVIGTVAVLERGAEFERAKALLEAKFQQYRELFPIEAGDSVILRLTPTKAVTWDYARGEMNEPGGHST
ncbi:MAG: pyridoxamine 5'-phosphate oxidase family protein [Candidatus Binatia bacterium]